MKVLYFLILASKQGLQGSTYFEHNSSLAIEILLIFSPDVDKSLSEKSAASIFARIE